jgi:hypothetical protein
MQVIILIHPANTVVVYFVAALNDDFTSSADDGTSILKCSAVHTQTHTNVCVRECCK